MKVKCLHDSKTQYSFKPTPNSGYDSMYNINSNMLQTDECENGFHCINVMERHFGLTSYTSEINTLFNV